MSVAKRLSKISLDDGTVNKVINGIPTSSLKNLYLADNRDADVSEWNRNDFKKHTIHAVRVAGIKNFVEQLKRDELQAALEPLNIDHLARNNNPNSKTVLAKRFHEQLESKGVSAYLNEYATIDQLTTYAEALSIVMPADSKKADYVASLVEEIERAGLELYLQSFSESVLRDVAFDMKLEQDPTATPSRGVIVPAIMEGKEIVHSKPKREKIVFSKTKKEIKKGVSFQDIFQHYTVEELVEWSRENQLKTTGTKKELINRILMFLDGDKENTLAGNRRVGRRRKSSSGQKKEAPKKEAPKKEAPKKEAPKKEEPKKEEPKKDEPAETEDEELDLDALNSYSLDRLKSYCAEEEIEVNGTKKKDYVAAILKYNEESEGESEE